MSEGWRSTKQHRFVDLGVRLPEVATDPIDLGPSRFESLHVQVSLADARSSSAAHLDEGRVVYTGALAATDRVVVADAASLEEFLVLHDASAPRAFAWTVQLPGDPHGITDVTEHEGAFHFDDARGNAKLVMRAPIAWDAHGARIPVHTAWIADRGAARGTLNVRIDASAAYAYPVVVDPKFETSVWLDVMKRLPDPRQGTPVAFDSARGELVLFGGSVLAVPVDDTWIWNGTVWTRRAPPVSPPARSGHALTYDSARGEVILFGGNSATLVGDTWAWDGANGTWTARTPATSPAPRGNHAMTFDSARVEVVLFGGYTTVRLGDTWVWNGANGTWTQRIKPSPPARSGCGLAYDSARDQVVLFGGTGTTGERNDTWTWSGASSTWTLRSPAASPGLRSDHAMTFDSARTKSSCRADTSVAASTPTPGLRAAQPPHRCPCSSSTRPRLPRRSGQR